MFPNPWATSMPPPAVTKPIINSYENNTQTYPFYAAANPLQNIPMTQSLQPNAIDPAMVQKWQEWKRWELWQQQFQWQQQASQMAAASTQSAPPPMPSSQPLQLPQPSQIPFQNHQHLFNQPGPPLPISNQPLQIAEKNEVGIKRGLEPELQKNEKKMKVDTTNKKELESNVETEALFEEQFKSWEEQFFKWKEQNKNHPDKAQYVEYEKKWLNWRDQLKQKCDILKKKRELKMLEKKKEAIQVEENKLLPQQKSCYDPITSNTTFFPNVPPTLQNSLNNSMIPPTSNTNQIPGLDLVANNGNGTKEFLNLSRILPQNQTGPIQTPDDKPFNFPKSIMNPAAANLQPVKMPLGNESQTPTSMYSNSSGWPNFNSSLPYYSQKPPDAENASMPKFNQQTDITSRPPYNRETSNTIYNNSQNAPNVNHGRPLEGSYNNVSHKTNTVYNTLSDDLNYNRNFDSFNTSYNKPSNNFHGYNQSNANNSNFNNFKRTPDNSNIPYQQSNPSSSVAPSKPPSLLSLNLVKPATLGKPGNYSDNKDIAPKRYERSWNVADEEDNLEDEYLEAHKKFSSEPFDDQNNDTFLNKQQGSMYNENNYSRSQQGARNSNEDYSMPLNQSRGPQMMRNTDNEYSRPNFQFSRNTNQSYSRGAQALKHNDDNYYKPQNNRNMEQGFSRGMTRSRNIDGDYSKEPVNDKNNFGSQRGNYGQPPRENYESPKKNVSSNMNRTNMEWDKDNIKKSGLQSLLKITPGAPPYEAPPIEVPPIDPVKIFDYRHLPTLKVIPGLSKESVIPIRIYDYKHGSKRIMPWQDRGFSRRNSNHTRNINEKGTIQDSNDFNINKETSNDNPTSSVTDFSSNEQNMSFIDYKNDGIKEKTTTKLETVVSAEEKEVQLQSNTEINDVRVPSPPKLLEIKEVEKKCSRQLLNIETLLCPPGRFNRPSKIIIILRGLPGSGKSYVAKLIKEKEVAMGGQAPRILSLDDYFMTEVTKTEIDPETNKKVEKKVMEYEHDSVNENLYRTSFIKAFKKKILENFFSFYILDAINNKVSYYKEIIDISRINGFTVYITELESDVDLCIKRNIHNRTAQDINSLMRSWVETPADQTLLDIRPLLHLPSKSEMEMEDVSDVEMELDRDEETTVDESKVDLDSKTDLEEEDIDVMKLLSCKWVDTIPQEEKMKRLDGLCKKKPESSIKEWLQIPEDDYVDREQEVVKDGKKRVRWADMEERREQEKMRAIGFVVGQTDWDRMLGRDQGESKLTQTKYI